MNAKMMNTKHFLATSALVALLCSLALAPSTKAGILTGPLTNTANGHIYYLLTETNWIAAEQEALALGGHLATIRNAAEESWIYTNFNYYNNVVRALWIGLYDTNPLVNSTNRATRRTEFAWISGEPVTYTHWSPVEPDNPDSSEGDNPPVWEFYGHIWDRDDLNAGTWNNYLNLVTIFGYPLNGVVEIVPIPNLTIVEKTTNQVALSWPAWATNYVLQSTSALGGTNWQSVTNLPATNANQLIVTNPIVGFARFFRLVQH